MAKPRDRKLLNVTKDDDLMVAIGELMRADTSKPTPPTMNEVVRKAVFEARDRLRQKAERRK
jgi:hypothetical protein